MINLAFAALLSANYIIKMGELNLVILSEWKTENYLNVRIKHSVFQTYQRDKYVIKET